MVETCPDICRQCSRNRTIALKEGRTMKTMKACNYMETVRELQEIADKVGMKASARCGFRSER